MLSQINLVPIILVTENQISWGDLFIKTIILKIFVNKQNRKKKDLSFKEILKIVP